MLHKRSKVYDSLPTEVPPTAGEVSFQHRRGIRFGTRHARRSTKTTGRGNERQRVLFQELQHRVANTLHSMAGTLEIAMSKIDSAPAEAGRILERAMRRISLLSDMHRCLNNPTLFDKGFSSILNDAVATAIDSHSTYISFQVDELGFVLRPDERHHDDCD